MDKELNGIVYLLRTFQLQKEDFRRYSELANHVQPGSSDAKYYAKRISVAKEQATQTAKELQAKKAKAVKLNHAEALKLLKDIPL